MRPDGTECFTILPDSEAFSMETLAWGYGGILEAIEGWYSEKSSYVEETGAPAGHYMALISPSLRYAERSFGSRNESAGNLRRGDSRCTAFSDRMGNSPGQNGCTLCRTAGARKNCPADHKGHMEHGLTNDAAWDVVLTDRQLVYQPDLIQKGEAYGLQAQEA